MTNDVRLRSLQKRGRRLVGPLLAGAVVLTAAACGSDGDAAGGGGETDKSVTVVFPAEPVSLDPCDDITGVNARVLRGNIVESLTTVDPSTGEVSPLLATEWEQVDPLTWQFTLRPDVTFHDGASFDAEAAAFGLNRTWDPELVCGTAQRFDGVQAEAVAVDESTVQVKTDVPDPLLPTRISYVDLPSPNTPQTKTNEPIGTGPYVFASHQPGQSITVERYDDYWGDAPDVESATYAWRTEGTVRASMVTSGEADLALEIPEQSAPDDDSSVEYTNNEMFFLRMGVDEPPLDDVRVRQAITQAIDKEQIVGSLMPRIGIPADQIVTQLVNGFIPDYAAPGYDQAAAAALIDEARADGVPVDTKITMISRVDLFAGAGEVMQAIQQAIADIGLNVEIQNLDANAWLEHLNKPFPENHPATIVATTHDNVTGDASFSFPKYFGSDGASSVLNDTEVDDLLAQAGEASGDARAELYQQIAGRVYDDIVNVATIAEMRGILMRSDRISYEPDALTNLEVRLSDITVTG